MLGVVIYYSDLKGAVVNYYEVFLFGCRNTGVILIGMTFGDSRLLFLVAEFSLVKLCCICLLPIEILKLIDEINSVVFSNIVEVCRYKYYLLFDSSIL